MSAASDVLRISPNGTSLLREPPSREQIASGKVSALVALLRALGDGDDPGDSFDDELERLLSD